MTRQAARASLLVSLLLAVCAFAEPRAVAAETVSEPYPANELGAVPLDRKRCTDDLGGTVEITTEFFRVPWHDPVDIFVRRTAAGGEILDEALLINDEPARPWAQLLCNGSGEFSVIYSNLADDEQRIRRFAPSAGGLQAALGLDALEPCRQQRLALGPAGRLVAACSRFTDGTEYVDMAVLAADASLLARLENLGTGDARSTDPVGLAVDRDGNALIMWRARDSSGTLHIAGRFVVGLDADEPAAAGPSFIILEGDELWRLVPTVSTEDIGLFSVRTHDDAKGGWVARRVSLHDEPVAIPQPSLEPLDPVFDRVARAGADLTEHPWAMRARPEIAGGSHTWIATWLGDFPDPARGRLSTRVLFARSRDDGRRWSSPRPVRDARADDGVPSIATDGRGTWMLVWHDDERYATTVYASRSLDDGRTWEPPHPVYRSRFSDHLCNHKLPAEARVATDGAGAWVIAWGLSTIRFDCDWQVSHSDQVLVARSGDDGLSWGEPTILASTDGGGAHGYCLARDPHGYGSRGLDVATDGTGAWAVLWADDAVWLARSSDDGHSWSPAAVLAAVGANAAEPTERSCDEFHSFHSSERLGHGARIATSPAGTWLATWALPAEAEAGYGADADVFAARSSDGAATWTEPVPVNSWAALDAATDDWPTAVSDGADGWLLVWRTHLGAAGMGFDADLVGARSDDDGATWSTPFALLASPPGDDVAHSPAALARSAAGVSMTAWTTPVGPVAGVPGQTVEVAISGDRCGDGHVDGGEECDDGNTDDADACTTTCALPGCGDGVTGAGEQCDDGNTDDADGCTNDCLLAACGDGLVWSGVEACDDGNASNTDDCLADCTLARCRDGFTHAGHEECDDGNYSDDDACTHDCELARCGDRHVHDGVEECDDGNTTDIDGCRNNCRLARCGDGVPALGLEDCDFRHPDQGRYCSELCRLAECPDADGDGRTTGSDALRILQAAVGMPVHCPVVACDVDRSRAIDATDAALALREVVDLDGGAICAEDFATGGSVVLRLESAVSVAALQLSIRYDSDANYFEDPAGDVTCRSSIAGGLSAFASFVGQLNALWVSVTGFDGPLELARCDFPPAVGSPSQAPAFEVEVVDVSGPDAKPLAPAPAVSVTFGPGAAR